MTARSSRRWWAATGAYALVVLALSVMPDPPGAPRVPYLDKALHLCQYLGLAWLLARTLAASRQAGGPVGLKAWGWATAYGGFIEIVQAVLPWRTGDLLDALANAAGAALGAWWARKRKPE